MELAKVKLVVECGISRIDDDETLETVLLNTHGLVWSEALDEYRWKEELKGASEKEIIVHAIMIGIFGKE